MIADIQELEEMDECEIHASGLNAKEVPTPMKGDNFISPVPDGTVESLGRNRRLRPSTFIKDRAERGEEQEVFRGEPDEHSSPTPRQDDSTRDDTEAKNDFLSMLGNFIYRHHVEPRGKLYVPTEESFPVPMKYVDVTRTTHTSLDVLLERNIDDYWNVDGKRELSDAWTGFSQVSVHPSVVAEISSQTESCSVEFTRMIEQLVKVPSVVSQDNPAADSRTDL